MPPQRGRASQACVACRKQKTRCYETSDSTACLRCKELHQPCSLDGVALHGRSQQRNNATDDDRLGRLERTVNALLQRLDNSWTPDNVTRGDSSQQQRSTRSSATPGLPQSGINSAAPVIAIRDVAVEVGLKDPAVSGQSVSTQVPVDLITKGIIQQSDVTSLLALFREHYGRWVSFNTVTPPELLLVEVQKSPLLLAACCLIAIRHTTQELATKLAPQLFQEAKSLLSNDLLAFPPPTGFFQAALILSLWSTTISPIPLSMDSWLISGFALQHCLASPLFESIAGTGRAMHSAGQGKLDQRSILNHLCLAHLHYCVGTRRKAIIDRTLLDKCREVLRFDQTTNFESRIVAEIDLYWVLYQSCNSVLVDLPKSQAALHSWKQEWGFMFNQPRSQFLQMGFHFAQLLIYDHSLKTRSAKVRESLLSEMVRLSAAILNLAMETSDDRTRHLSDHVYHMITFAAITLCRLMHTYEPQVSNLYDLNELDSLVRTLETWLRSIGLPCHVAHTLGDIVAAFHSKLRPGVQPWPTQHDDTVDQLSFAYMLPELIGTSSLDDDFTNLWPDWAVSPEDLLNTVD